MSTPRDWAEALYGRWVRHTNGLPPRFTGYLPPEPVPGTEPTPTALYRWWNLTDDARAWWEEQVIEHDRWCDATTLVVPESALLED